MLLQSGRQTTFDVPLGGTLAISAGIGTGSLIRLPNGGGDPIYAGAITGGVQTFGPFDDLALFRMICDAGVINYTVQAPSKAVVKQYRKNVVRNTRSTIIVPANSKLIVAAHTPGVGVIYPVSNGAPGSVVSFTGAAISIDNNTNFPVIYVVECVVGQMLVTTGYFSDIPLYGLSDVALNMGANATKYIDLGNASLPSGDWVIGLAFKTPASNPYDQNLITWGDEVGNMPGASPNLILFWPQPNSSISIDPARGAMILSGRDDAGAWLATNNNRSISTYQTSTAGTRYLSGQRKGAPADNIGRYVFIQKKAGVVELWVVEDGCVALLHDFNNSSFTTLTNKPLRLLRASNTAGWDGQNMLFQRFFLCAGQTLTAAQMDMIASGVDPRNFLTMDAAKGDRLLAFQNNAANQPDQLPGAPAATVVGAWTVSGTKIVPSTILPDMVRANIRGNGQVIQRTGTVTSDLVLNGTVSGDDGDVYCRVVDFTTKAVVVDWTLMGTSVKGEWSGKFNNSVPSNVYQWYDLQTRKGLAGTVYTLNRKFGLGIVVDVWGQSIGEKMRTSASYTATGTGAGFTSFYSRSKSNGGSTQGGYTRGWNNTNSGGSGEARLAQFLHAGGCSCPVGIIMSAIEGSSTTAWDSPAADGYKSGAYSWQENRPGYLVWSQGQGSTNLTRAQYQSFLDSLLTQARGDFPWNWKLIIEPLNANGTGAANGGVFSILREAQHDWAVAKRSSGDLLISSAGNFNDLKMSDGVHPSTDNTGNGRIAERLATNILFHEGVLANTAEGPKITGAVRNGATVTVTLTHNGGAGLRTPNVGNITGFEVSTDNFATSLTITSALITGANTIDIVLAADPGAAVKVRYQYGNPGPSVTPLDGNGYIAAISNPVYDDRSPMGNTTLGYPVMFTSMAGIAAT